MIPTVSATSTLVGISRRLGLVLDPAAGSEGGGLGWILDGPWVALIALFALAVAVMSVSRTLSQRSIGGDARKGRGPDFDLNTAHLDSLPITRVAEAGAGPVHLQGKLASASQLLGGKEGRECVWTNRSGSSRDTAIAAELVLLSDDSGQAGIEGLERARVIAPREKRVAGHETVSLYLGDEVQVLGQFRPERHGDEDDSGQRVYGMLGSGSPVQVRLLSRASDEPPS